jgi:hypothetical protein
MDHILRRALLAAVLALAALSALATTANASRSLSLNPARGFSAASLGLLSFNMTIQGVPVAVTCTVTLNGSLSSIIPKRSGTLFGKVTAVGIGSGGNGTCNPFLGNAMSTGVFGLPWKLAYLSFVGRLPSPNLVVFHIRGLSWIWHINGVFPASGCSFRGDVSVSMLFPGTTPNTSGLIHTLRGFVPGITPDALCPRVAEVVALFALTPRQTLILVN